MRLAARKYALTCSWDAVFDRVYNAYGDVLDRYRERSGEGAVSNPA